MTASSDQRTAGFFIPRSTAVCPRTIQTIQLATRPTGCTDLIIAGAWNRSVPKRGSDVCLDPLPLVGRLRRAGQPHTRRAIGLQGLRPCRDPYGRVWRCLRIRLAPLIYVAHQASAITTAAPLMIGPMRSTC